MSSKGLNALIVTQPNQLCWLLNIRGDDLKYTPLFLGFLVIEKNGKINIFSRNRNKTLQNSYNNKFFSNLIPYIEKFKNQKVGININYCPSIIFEKLRKSNIEIDENFTFLQEASTIKNKNEIIFIRKCHLRDGAAFIKFLYWIEKEIPSNKISEYQASCKLKEYRSQDKNFISESFPSIVATGGNGAIIHYRPLKDKSKIISQDKLFLIDSGGQYFDGTTDITRTVSFKNQSQDVINKYTYVLKAHIAMAKLKFKATTRGNEIDSIVRSKLWEVGLDYDHGTGHGVGFCLGVHEFPPVISKNTSLPLKEGYLLSNEPGYYVKDKFGIRLENLVIVQNSTSSDKEFFEFETVSLCHFERKLINKKLLDKDEIIWINKYHKFVYQNLKVLLNTKEKLWLKRKTDKI
jgi:Xaa-Pro aminopeptidase